jgi:hypothetical protein
VVKVNGKIVVDYTEPKGTTDARRIGRGSLALQAHDQDSSTGVYGSVRRLSYLPWKSAAD